LSLMAGGPSGRKEGKGKRGNGRGLEWVINCLNWRACWGEKGRGEGGARRNPRGCGGGRRAGGRRKGRREGEADRWGPGISECEEKKKREGEAGRRGTASWASRPDWAER
jgi:hypothetical protein